MSAAREWMFRVWYRYVNNLDKKAEILFMNFGYVDPGSQPVLEAEDEPNRFSVQLYHLLGTAADINNKDIAEIGCGRGGGLSYIVRTFKPKTALGIDLDKNAVKFCNKNYHHKGLSFLQGDAQNLSFLPDESFDIILNNESSHRYPHMDLFLKEVHRLLRPGGYFLFSDFRNDHDMDELKQMIESSGLKVLREKDITSNVVKALEADDGRKRLLVKKLTPRIIHKIALNFAGAMGSETYNKFANRRFEYFHYVMQKA
jgi:ubiquinone/menaquinone biosynthesis C-methylase UbiE